jgi:segregation and condensation protein B
LQDGSYSSNFHNLVINGFQISTDQINGSYYSMSESKYQDPSEISARLEALIFVSAQPVEPAQLAMILAIPVSTVEQGLKQLDLDLVQRGLRLQRHDGKVQLTTAPQLAGLIEQFLGIEAVSRLSRAALETLAIIAYQQPVTRPQIDAIRGVSSDGVMKSLLGKGLIDEAGRTEGPGRPILYKTTPDFLRHFGLNSQADLPLMDLQEEVIDGDNGARKGLA